MFLRQHSFPFQLRERRRYTKTGDHDAKTIKKHHAILNSPGNLKRYAIGCAISEKRAEKVVTFRNGKKGDSVVEIAFARIPVLRTHYLELFYW